MSDDKLLTCVTCHVAFRDADNQRLHFQTEWHTYNLKRKVAQMKPVSLAEFQSKVSAQQVKTKQAEDLLSYTASCTVCNKHYSSKNAYENHLNSKKHKENELNAKENPLEVKHKAKPRKASSSAEETEVEDKILESSLKHEKPQKNEEVEIKNEENMEEDEELKAIDQKIANARKLKMEECLFCLFESETFEDNLTHMATSHSFFIPDVQYLVDTQGLIKYLGEKISVGNVCLYCNERGRSFHSLEAVQKHMIDKGHCKIWYEDDADIEFEEFYDFSPSYPDHGEHDSNEEPVELTPVISSYEMILPNGTKLGHRSLRSVYKQKFKSEDTRQSTLVNKIVSQYRALGWHEQPQEVNSREMKRMIRTQQKKEMELGVKSNGLLKHMRAQVMC